MDLLGQDSPHLTHDSQNFSTPKTPNVDLGDEPVVITRNTTVDVYLTTAAAEAALADGELYMILGSSSLYIADSTTTTDIIATGLEVKGGKTLTLGLNTNWYANTGQDTVDLYFDDDVVISGTVTTKGLSTGDLNGGIIENRHGAPATAAEAGSRASPRGAGLRGRPSPQRWRPERGRVVAANAR